MPQHQLLVPSGSAENKAAGSMSDDSDIMEAHTTSKRSRSKLESACRPTQLMKQEQKACTRKGMIDKEEAKKMDPVGTTSASGKPLGLSLGASFGTCIRVGQGRLLIGI